MAGDLTLSGGGSTTVASDHLLELIAQLRALELASDEWHSRLQRSDAFASSVQGRTMLSDHDPGDHAASAALRLRDASDTAGSLASRLTMAADLYGTIERTVTGLAEQAGAWLGHQVGVAARVLSFIALVPPSMSVALALGAGSLAASVWMLTGGDPAGWLQRNKKALSDPRVVAAIRVFASSADNGILGALGASALVGRALDDGKAGLVGRAGAARAIVGLGAITGVGLAETPVHATRVTMSRAEPPRGYADLAARIPTGRTGTPQVRIERYDVDGERRFIAFVGGTRDASLRAGAEPFDDTSNLQAVAALDPGSLRVVREALERSGAQPGDSLLQVGYSQGGLVTTALALDNTYRSEGLLTFGSPTSGVVLPRDINDVAVEHAEDPIHALGGLPPSGNDGLNRLLVRRTVLDNLPAQDDEIIPGHDLDRYRDTAREMDASTDARLQRMRSTLETLYTGEAKVSEWHGERVSARASSGRE